MNLSGCCDVRGDDSRCGVGWGAVFPGPRRFMKPRSASRTSFPWSRLGISTASCCRTTEKQRVHCQDRLYFGSREHRLYSSRSEERTAVRSGVGHWPTCRRALRRGLLSRRIIPLRGECNSRIRKTAHETEIAQKNRVKIAVALRGAKSPRLMNITVSHEATTSRSGVEAEVLCCSNSSQRVCPRSNKIPNAWAFAAR